MVPTEQMHGVPERVLRRWERIQRGHLHKGSNIRADNDGCGSANVFALVLLAFGPLGGWTPVRIPLMHGAPGKYRIHARRPAYPFTALLELDKVFEFLDPIGLARN